MAHAGFYNGLGAAEEEVIESFENVLAVIEESNHLIGECNYRNICKADRQNRGVRRKVLSAPIG